MVYSSIKKTNRRRLRKQSPTENFLPALSNSEKRNKEEEAEEKRGRTKKQERRYYLLQLMDSAVL